MDWVAIWGRAVRELPVRSERDVRRFARAVERYAVALGSPVPAWILAAREARSRAMYPECPF